MQETSESGVLTGKNVVTALRGWRRKKKERRNKRALSFPIVEKWVGPGVQSPFTDSERIYVTPPANITPRGLIYLKVNFIILFNMKFKQ